MHELKFSIKILSPVVISAASNSTLMTGSHDEISGSVIRGVLASKYIQEKKLKHSTAYENENFRKLFYGGLKFLSATPAIKGARSFILPLSLQRGKKGTDNAKNIQDLLTADKPPAGYKSLRGYGIVDGDKIFTASVKKNIYMHMSRSAANERISGKSQDGQIYNYEALESGQTFCGAILGTATDLQELQLKNKNFVGSIGRSRFTQYGNCEFNFGSIEEIVPENLGEKIYLRLESPLISAEDNFISAEKVLQAEVIEKLGENFSLGKVFAAGVEVENFIKIWGMKSPRAQAVAAGTVFELETKNLTAADKKILCEKIYSGFGVRTEEGFGQVRIWDSKNFTLAKIDAVKIPKPENFSEKTLEIARKILLEKYLEQLRIYAHEDANKLTAQLQRGNFTHFFSRLDNLLSTAGKENIRKNFSTKIENECNDGKIFQDNLKKIYVGEQKLFDVLAGNANLPYEGKNILSGNTEKLFGEIDFDAENFNDRFFLEYFQNYFRAARKIAALKGGDSVD